MQTKQGKMSPPNTCYNCVKNPSGKAGKAKAVLRGLLQNKPTPSPSSSPRVRPTLCRACKTAANRQGKIFNDPLRCHVPYDAPSSRSDKSGQCEINRYIWGDITGSSGGEEDVLVNRVYSMLRLESSPVLEYLERNGGDLSGLPPNVRRRFERVIRVQVRSLQIGVAY
ncbi:hypothetical protein F5B21DRAFT_479046 [Xylaria acuta]|nr:hypothetical protein F5B21DRAFT_479046 [Xylaria acuta]